MLDIFSLRLCRKLVLRFLIQSGDEKEFTFDIYFKGEKKVGEIIMSDL